MNDTVLRDIGLYKEKILSSLLDSDDIKDILLIEENYTDELWYGKEDDDSDYGIQYKQIFPFLYIDETQTKVKSYLCFDIDTPSFNSRSTKEIKIIIWCICHKDNMKFSKTGYSGTRADILADAVERALRNSETIINDGKITARFGIGDLHLDSVTQLSSQNKVYYGRQLIFTTPDFMIKKSR